MRIGHAIKVASLVLVALATLLIYRPALKGGFVFDDFDEVVDNPWIKSGFVDAARAKPFRAIPAISYRLDYLISGRVSASNSHLINLVFHVFAAFALGAFWRKAALWSDLGKESAWWVGAMSGAAFLWHPLNVEAVSYVSARGNLIGALFVFSGLWLVFKAFEGGFKASWYVGSMLAISASLFCNESAAAGPVLGGALCVFIGTREGAYAPSLEKLGRYMVFCIPYALILMVWTALRLSHYVDWGVEGTASGIERDWTTPFWAIGTYTRSALWPVGLSMEHGFGTLKSAGAVAHFLLGVVILILGIGAGYWGWRSSSKFGSLSGFAALMWVVFLLAVTAAPLADPVAERRAYIAMGFIGWIPAVMIYSVERRWVWAKAAVYMGLAAIFLWGVSGGYYVTKWRTPLILWTNSVKWQPSSSRGWDWLGYSLLESGDLRAAGKAFEVAIMKAPASSYPERNLAIALAKSKEFDAAAEHFEKAIKKNPNDWRAHLSYGVLETERGNYPTAEMRIRRAISINPDHALSWFDLGNALRLQGKLDAAKEAYGEAIRLDPHQLDARLNLAQVNEMSGDLDAARMQIAELLTLEPGYKPALLVASRLEFRLGDMDGAIRYLKLYDESRGEAFEKLIGLAAKLRQMGHESEAQMALEEAAKLNRAQKTDAEPAPGKPNPGQ